MADGDWPWPPQEDVNVIKLEERLALLPLVQYIYINELRKPLVIDPEPTGPDAEKLKQVLVGQDEQYMRRAWEAAFMLLRVGEEVQRSIDKREKRHG